MDKRRPEIIENPYPYRAMLCICSDLDETVSADVYFNTSQFLNSKESTPFGQGVGLETGNTMYFYMAGDDFSYWNASDEERDRIRDMMRAGLIDCIHSFGDTANERSQVEETLAHLDAESCYLTVWIDHATAPTNFGADIMQGYGDLSGHTAYHADLTLDYGIRYLSMGRVTSMFGQDAPVSLRGIYRSGDAAASLVTLAKETSKVALATLGNRKYEMHGTNRLLREAKLRDGQEIFEFIRSNPNPGGVSAGDNATGLSKALSPEFLHGIVKRRSKSVIYTHLGKEIDETTGFPAETREALERLAGLYSAGEILVTTTRRLLDYAAMRDSLAWDVESHDEHVQIAVSSSRSGEVFDGLSFWVPDDRPHRVSIDGAYVDVDEIDAGQDGWRVLTIPWRRLS